MDWLNAALAQKKLLTYFSLNFLSIFCLALNIPFGSVLLAIGVSIYQAKLIFDAHCLMTCCDNSSKPYILSALSIIPGIGIIIMISLHSGCTASLKMAGIKSGLWGVSSTTIAAARSSNLKEPA